jgi:prepilin-type N-terminal cleavage/methylation domain-containing protein
VIHSNATKDANRSGHALATGNSSLEGEMKTSRGFSLLELLIVVAIILIIATIAIPSLLKSRQSANESSAVSNLRLLNTAEVTYGSGHQGSYGDISDLVSAGLLDARFNQIVSGYSFSVDVSVDTYDYTANAVARANNDGRFDYYTKPDYIIRYSADPLRAPTGLTGEPVR